MNESLNLYRHYILIDIFGPVIYPIKIPFESFTNNICVCNGPLGDVTLYFTPFELSMVIGAVLLTFKDDNINLFLVSTKYLSIDIGCESVTDDMIKESPFDEFGSTIATNEFPLEEELLDKEFAMEVFLNIRLVVSCEAMCQLDGK